MTEVIDPTAHTKLGGPNDKPVVVISEMIANDEFAREPTVIACVDIAEARQIYSNAVTRFSAEAKTVDRHGTEFDSYEYTVITLPESDHIVRVDRF